MISLTALLLGLINVCIVVVVLLLFGAIIMWIASILGFAVPATVQKLYMVIVALVALYMLVALLLGLPVIKIVGAIGSSFEIAAFTPPSINVTVSTA